MATHPGSHSRPSLSPASLALPPPGLPPPHRRTVSRRMSPGSPVGSSWSTSAVAPLYCVLCLMRLHVLEEITFARALLSFSSRARRSSMLLRLRSCLHRIAFWRRVIAAQWCDETAPSSAAAIATSEPLCSSPPRPSPVPPPPDTPAARVPASPSTPAPILGLRFGGRAIQLLARVGCLHRLRGATRCPPTVLAGCPLGRFRSPPRSGPDWPS